MNTLWIYGAVLFLLIITLIIVTGVEYAYLNSNPLTLELRRDRKKHHKHLGKLLDNMDVFWRTTTLMFYLLVIGIVMITYSILQGVLSLPTVSPSIKAYMDSYDYMLLILCAIICVILIMLAKKGVAARIFKRNSERKMDIFAGFIHLNSKFFNPIAIVFKKVSEFILVYLFNARINKQAPVFQGVDAKNFYKHSIQGYHVLETINKRIFQGAIDLTRVNVRNCITPRTEIIAVDKQSPIEVLIEKFVETKVSKIVIYHKHLDHIEGYVHHLDMNTHPKEITDVLLPLPAVPEAMSALDLVRMFTRERKSMALVVDEFGGTCGLVTMEDILEEIFGSIKDEYDADEMVEKQLSDHEFVFSGRLKVDYLNNKYGFNIPKEDYETLSGFIISRHESIPGPKQRIIIGRFEFEMLLVTATKIESVKMRLLNH